MTFSSPASRGAKKPNTGETSKGAMETNLTLINKQKTHQKMPWDKLMAELNQTFTKYLPGTYKTLPEAQRTQGIDALT